MGPSPPSQPPARARRERALTAAAVALLTIYAIWRRAIDLDPPSLWLDDAWVAVLARLPDLAERVACSSSTPPLFALLVSWSIALLPDPEVGAQVLPFVAGALVVPLTGYVAWSLSGRPVVAIVAALLLAADPLAITYSARVKQYSTDALITVLHLLALQRVRASPSRWAPWLWVGLGAVGVLVSTVSLFVLVCFVAALVVDRWHDRARRPHVLGAGSALVVVAGVLATTVLARGVNGALEAWWKDHFLPTTSLSGFLTAAGGALGTWVCRPLGGRDGAVEFAAVGACLVLLGGAGLVRAGHRAAALGMAALPLLLVCASAVRRFPLGTGRVELFLAPLVALLLALGLLVADTVRAPVWRRAWPPLVCALLAVHLHRPRTPQYPVQEFAPLVAHVSERLGPDDLLVVNDHALFALCYYGPWPVETAEHARFATGFVPVPVGVRLAIVESREDALPPDFLDAALSSRPRRVHLFLGHDYGMSGAAPSAARRNGFEVVDRAQRDGCVVLTLEPRS